MLRLILGIILGVVAWFVVVLGISYALRAADPALATALNLHATTTALAERLVISFVGSLLSGALAAWLGGGRAALIAGVLQLLFWGTYHVMVIWHQFPVWYHLTFFVSLVALSVLGGRVARR